MKAIVCDKCGKLQENMYFGLFAEINMPYIGYPSEIQLCKECAKDFLDWLRKEKKNGTD